MKILNAEKVLLKTEKYKKKQFKKNLKEMKRSIKCAYKNGEFEITCHCPLDEAETYVKLLENSGYRVKTLESSFSNNKLLVISWGIVSANDKESSNESK